MEQSSKTLKVLLGILLLILLATLTFVFLRQKETFRKETSTPVLVPVTTSRGEVVKTPPVETERPAGDSVTPIPSENQKEITTIQDQLKAGTLSPEEAVKQMNALAPPAPPLPSTEVKK